MHEPAGELIDNDYLTVLHHIIAVFLEQYVCFESIINVVGEGIVRWGIKIGDMQPLLHLAQADLGQRDGPRAFLQNIILTLSQPGNQFGKRIIFLCCIFSSSADDERSTRLIYEDVVHFIDDGIIELPLYALGEVNHHVVPEIIETELIVSAM